MRELPYPTIILLKWREKDYLGSIQEITPTYSKEIVYLSKTSKPIPQELADALKRVEPTILELGAENFLDLEGRGHILRNLEGKLTIMTTEQTAYMLEHPIDITEI